MPVLAAADQLPVLLEVFPRTEDPLLLQKEPGVVLVPRAVESLDITVAPFQPLDEEPLSALGQFDAASADLRIEGLRAGSQKVPVPSDMFLCPVDPSPQHLRLVSHQRWMTQNALYRRIDRDLQAFEELLRDRLVTSLAEPPGDQPLLERDHLDPLDRPVGQRHDLLERVESQPAHRPEVSPDFGFALARLLNVDDAGRHRRDPPKALLRRGIVQ